MEKFNQPYNQTQAARWIMPHLIPPTTAPASVIVCLKLYQRSTSGFVLIYYVLLSLQCLTEGSQGFYCKTATYGEFSSNILRSIGNKFTSVKQIQE